MNWPATPWVEAAPYLKRLKLSQLQKNVRILFQSNVN
jgi:hypothetical protein